MKSQAIKKLTQDLDCYVRNLRRSQFPQMKNYLFDLQASSIYQHPKAISVIQILDQTKIAKQTLPQSSKSYRDIIPIQKSKSPTKSVRISLSDWCKVIEKRDSHLAQLNIFIAQQFSK